MTTSADRFDVVIVPFPFVDMAVTKRRPAVVISDRTFNDATQAAIMAMITSAYDSEWHEDVMVSDIETAGLRSPCKIRMKLFTIDLALSSDPVGYLTDADRRELEIALRRVMLP